MTERRTADAGSTGRLPRRTGALTAVLVTCLLTVSVSCRKEPPARAGVAAESTSAPAGEVPPTWTREGLEVQPAMKSLQQRTPPESGAKPGSTPWTSASIELPTDGAASAGGLLSAVIKSQNWGDILGDAAWEQTTRVFSESDTSAVGVVLQWDFQDDAVAGRDFRVLMRQARGMWHVRQIDQRYHCRRAVNPDGRCS